MSRLKTIQIGLFAGLMLFLFLQKSFGENAPAVVQNLEFNEENVLKISLSKKAKFKIFTLQNPDRLVVDVIDAKFLSPDYKPSLPSFVSSFRSRQTDDSLRIVFDLKQKISLQKSRFEKIKNSDSGKIVVEISGVKTAAKTAEKSEAKPSSNHANSSAKANNDELEVETKKITNADGSATYVVKKTLKNSDPKATNSKASNAVLNKIPTIVIDAGHGGKDPGTIGSFARTKEKNLTLSYAKELGKYLVRTKRYRVFLTRDTDIFIPLHQRVQIAHRRKADLFISLHANAAADHDASGFSIYTLSEKSSDKQAELLAQKENRSDIISGVDFSGASQDIMKTLIDMSQRESKNSSSRFANGVINSVKKLNIEVLENTHRFAGFAVLTAPDMTSVLIELGYLSNKKEEYLLNSLSYKRKVAEGVTYAIDEFFLKKN